MPHKSQDYKVTAVQHYLNVSHNREETCRIFGCKSITLGRWVLNDTFRKIHKKDTIENHARKR
jgi:transposase-like protein